MCMYSIYELPCALWTSIIDRRPPPTLATAPQRIPEARASAATCRHTDRRHSRPPIPQSTAQPTSGCGSLHPGESPSTSSRGSLTLKSPSTRCQNSPLCDPSLTPSRLPRLIGDGRCICCTSRRTHRDRWPCCAWAHTASPVTPAAQGTVGRRLLRSTTSSLSPARCPLPRQPDRAARSSVGRGDGRSIRTAEGLVGRRFPFRCCRGSGGSELRDPALPSMGSSALRARRSNRSPWRDFHAESQVQKKGGMAGLSSEDSYTFFVIKRRR
ncbi:hypothetical protein FA95DRAFT_476897 [Auriscalpium vulgare]|uniref:Uncharacterized protein n=1 Tax=Auriscalpium vulgare TaxID=40419 RepID=A0ACB8SAS0_9AGAM|nr:hypothetical protein FA95DRAFT_476897 [Auriscalpium vulgare]